MEDQRLDASGFSDMSEENVTPILRALRAPLLPTAVLSVCVLGCVALWSIFGSHTEVAAAPPSIVASAMQSADNADPTVELVSTIQNNAAQDPQIDVSAIGPSVVGALAAQYSALKQQGIYTPAAGDAAAQQLAQAVNVPVPYKAFTAADVHTSSDSSYSAMLSYRNKLKDALAPLVSIKDPEIGIFAGYVQTKNPKYLDELRAVAADYQAAAAASATLTVPSDAAAYHLGILNAMAQFGATLQALADNADNPITSVVLLQNYNDGERTMVSSFNNLAMYFAHHSKP